MRRGFLLLGAPHEAEENRIGRRFAHVKQQNAGQMRDDLTERSTRNNNRARNNETL